MASKPDKATGKAQNSNQRQRRPAVPAALTRLHAVRREFASFIATTGLEDTPDSALLFAKEREQFFALTERQIVMALHGRLPFGYDK